MRLDLDGQEADHVLVDVGLALELGDGRGRGIDVEHHIVCLAVLRDAISETAKTPGLRLGDLPAIVFDDLGGVFRECVHLGLSQVLTREENMLIEWHASVSLLADRWRRPVRRPSDCRKKALGRETSPHPVEGAYGETTPQKQGDWKQLSSAKQSMPK